ncbi:FAD synthase [Microplitis demolitor]|uniref:FAD synthase n=1 Tax=Microplitis demolitor TaxID=69319 RepID=UPI0004CCC11D|nr:FAD synthase [Microplitis demolitor]
MFQVFRHLRNIILHSLNKYSFITYKSFSSCQKYTAGLIIIGDEILKAQVRDTNSYFMCSLLYEYGVKVEKISIISDDIDEIANEIKLFSGRYKYVIASGGVGPTHDDKTYEGLAKAFGDSLHFHPTLVDIIKELNNNDDENSPLFKVAYIPKKATLKFGKSNSGELLKFPCVNVDNVYIFPGSPIYFEPLFKNLCQEIFNAHKKFFKKELYIDAKEDVFANALTSVAKEFPNVAFGSYPISNQNYYKARVTIESDEKSITEEATNKFCSLISPDILVNYDKTPEINSVEKYQDFQSKSDPSKALIYSETIKELKKIFDNPKEIVIEYNYSMESTVLLHLIHIVRSLLNSNFIINAVFFKHQNIPAVIEKSCIDILNRYNAKLTVLDEPKKVNVENFKILYPELKTLLLTKTNDANNDSSGFKFMEQLSPSIEIKTPLSGWNSETICTFTRSLCLPYV